MHDFTVRLKLFAGARQTAGCDELEIGLPAGATVGQLRAALVDRRPELAGLVRRAVFAVDRRFAVDSLVLPPAAEVALIPPVSGG